MLTRLGTGTSGVGPASRGSKSPEIDIVTPPKKMLNIVMFPPSLRFGLDLCHFFFLDLFTFRFPQQRKIMGSSAQNSSGVHWCRRRVRFNEVPEKVPEKVGRLWCRARWGSTGFRRRFRRRFQEALVQSQVRFNGFRRGSGEGLGGFGAEKVPEKVWEALEHAEVFPALGFAACFRKIGKNKTLRLLGIPRFFFWIAINRDCKSNWRVNRDASIAITCYYLSYQFFRGVLRCRALTHSQINEWMNREMTLNRNVLCVSVYVYMYICIYDIW